MTDLMRGIGPGVEGEYVDSSLTQLPQDPVDDNEDDEDDDWMFDCVDGTTIIGTDLHGPRFYEDNDGDGEVDDWLHQLSRIQLKLITHYADTRRGVASPRSLRDTLDERTNAYRLCSRWDGGKNPSIKACREKPTSLVWKSSRIRISIFSRCHHCNSASEPGQVVSFRAPRALGRESGTQRSPSLTSRWL